MYPCSKLQTVILLALIWPLLARADVASTSQPFRSAFTGVANNYEYRIPAMVVSNKGTVIVSCDGRFSNADVPGRIDNVIRRSTDNGATWGPVIVTANYGTDTTDTDLYPIFNATTAQTRTSASDPALLVDRTNGRIWVFYDNGSTASYNGFGRTIKLEMRYSDDDGLTWSARKDIESENPALRPTAAETYLFNGTTYTYNKAEYIVGPGNGIQIERGIHAGRLIFPVYWYRSSNCSSFIYSDDHGATWQRGGICGAGTGEVQIVELADGSLLASMRPSGAGSGYRWFSKSTDDGATWGPLGSGVTSAGMTRFDATTAYPVADPTCQGSIFRLTSTSDSDKNRLVEANCDSTASRVKMTVRVSYDEGANWSTSKLIYTSTGGYCALTRLANGDIGLLYEKDSYASIDFVRLPLSDATGGADALPDYNFGRLAIIGDSITQATGNSAAFAQNGSRGYRWHLFKKLIDAGASFDLVGSINTNYALDSQYPTWRGAPFDRANEGHYAWRAYEIRNGPDAARLGSNRGTGSITQWTDPKLGGYTPDTAFLMIGINDTSSRTATAIRDDAAAIIDTLQSRNPKIRIFLSELLYSNNVTNSLVDTYNALLPALATAKTTATSKVTVVTMLNGQTGGWNATNMTYDNTHPNSRGEPYVAGRIAAAMGLPAPWTAVSVTNGNFEGGFTGAGTVSCAPAGWTLYGTPNASAVPKQVTDYSAVAESTVDNVASGTGSSGSSYTIAGTADTGIKQALSETLTAGRRYMLQVSAYSGSSALTAGDWGVEVWAGTTLVGAADNKVKLNLYATGTGSQIGSKLTELTAEFDAADYPAAQGQALQIRLISRNNTRYVGFEDVRLSWKSSPAAPLPSTHYKMYVLTGQSNSLGTDSGTEIDRLPGLDPADGQVRFWWANVADATVSVGNSGGFWRTLGAQPAYNYYSNIANAWGPEINFGRTLYHAGERNFVIVKASRGGGGNSLWDKVQADHHMYTQVVNTVTAAGTRLTAEGHTYEIAGLLYLQGESNTAAEAAVAGDRFKTLVDNLRTDLPNAATMKGYMVGNIDSSADDATTRARQETIAAANPSYLSYVNSLDLQDELVSDNLHHNKKAKLVNGARFAQSVLGAAAEYDAAAGYGAPHGVNYGASAAGNAPETGLATNLDAGSPVLQGWSEERSATATGQSTEYVAADPVSGTPAWNITDGDATATGCYYSRNLTATQLSSFAASGWIYTLNCRFAAGYADAPGFFLQYGDASSRWIAWLQRSDTGALTATFTGASGSQTVTLQAAYDNTFHLFALRKSAMGGTTADLLFDGAVSGSVASTTADAALEPGVHFGVNSAAGKANVNIAGAAMVAADTALPGATIIATDPYLYETVKTTGQFTVSMWPAPATDTTVNLTWSGTATSGVDYTALPSSVLIPAGQTSTTVTVTGLNDAVTEGPESIIGTIAAGSGYTVDTPSSATATLSEYGDNVSIAATTPTASKTGSGSSGVFTLTRDLTAGALTVNLTVSGTAVSGTDYTALPATATFADGQMTATVTVAPIPDSLYMRTPKTVIATIAAGNGYNPGTPSSAQVNITSALATPAKANNATALNVAGSWLGDAPSTTEAPVWNNTVTSANSVSLGVATTWGGLTIGSGASAPGGDVTLTGAYALTITGTIDTGSTRNLTIGAKDGGVLNLANAVLIGSTTLTINKTASTAYPSFNAANALAFNGTLVLRGATVSSAPGSMGGVAMWLHASSGSQLAGTKFILDTGASTSNGMDFILGDWDSTGTRTLTLSGLTGYGTIRTDAGSAGARNLIVDQATDTIFNGMLLSHTSSAAAVRSIAFEKKGVGSLTMNGVIGKQTASAGAAASNVAITITAGTLVLTATNTLTGATTVNGGTLIINGTHPSTSAVTVAAAGTLAGLGTINSAVTVNGTLAPGNNGIGTLSFSGTLSLGAASTAAMQVNKSGATLTADKVQGATTLTYGGTLTVTATGDALAAGDSFTLFSAATRTGSFTTVNLPALTGGLTWNSSALTTTGVVTVIKGSQTISFGALAAKTFGNADFAPGATASSGLAVTYASSNTAVATIVDGQIHIVGGGTTTITASQAGDATYAAATDATQGLTVNPAAQTLTFGALPLKNVGDADFAPGATASSGLVVAYASSDTAVATIVDGNIHIVGGGTATITASQAGNTNFAAATGVIQTLTVNRAPLFTANPVAKGNAPYGSAYSATLAGAATDGDGDTLVFAKVSGPAWLMVAAGGALSGTPAASDVGANSFTVSVTDSKCTAVTATLQVTVTDAVKPVLTVPADTVVTLTDSTLPASTGTATAVDEVTASPTIGYTDVLTGAAPDPYYITRTWTATDAAGNAATADQRIIVIKTAAVAADTETTQEGTRSGTFAATLAEDGVYESLTEYVPASGSSRWSLLNHRWTFAVPACDFATFRVKASRADNADGDNFRFRYSLDGKTFRDMVTVASPTAAVQTFELPQEVSGQTVYIQASDTDASLGKAVADTLAVDLLAIETESWPTGLVPPNRAAVPLPADASRPVSRTPTLSWQAGASATGWNLYLGTSTVLGATEFQGSLTSASFKPATLEYATTYYWRVDASNTNGEAAGTVWSFTTQRDPAQKAASLHVQSIKLDYCLYSGKYRARATVKVVNDLGKPVSGATVNGIFSGSCKEYRSTAADSTGTAVIISATGFTSAPGPFEFRISSASGPLPYAPADNTVTSAQY